MGLVHRPSFVGCGGETSGEQDSLVLAEAGDFFQKLLHALAFFFHLTKSYAAPLDESTRRARAPQRLVSFC